MLVGDEVRAAGRSLSAYAQLPPPECGRWHVLHTLSRHEKTLAASLCAMGIACYLPLIRQVRYYGGRKFNVQVPLFPGYVFLRGSTEEAYVADRTGHVARIIPVCAQEQLDWELRNLHAAISRDAPLTMCQFLRKGVRVEIRNGPFAGIQGVVENLLRNDRVLLRVELLGQATALDIDGALLTVLE